ncbi:MAG: ABC transporter permease [Ardenticatenaceae bacterium]|nr:ABC transporter permease [Ardenticatenaceae bacterium]
MRRFLSLLAHEFKLARTTIPIHAVAILEPVILYALLTAILVHPSLDVYITNPTTEIGRSLVTAMQSIGSPIGQTYINPILTDKTEPDGLRQVITVEEINGITTAVQKYNLIDSNLVKNYRNRLTAAALKLWNENLGNAGVEVVQEPSLPFDIPYTVYFGMAMLPLAAMLSASMIGAILIAQEFELQTIDEYRVAPIPTWMVLSARLVRLVLSAAIAAGLLLVVNGLINSYWPDSIGMVALILLPIAIIGSCLGMIIGLQTRTTLPAFILTLATSITFWIIGDSFKPAALFGGFYQFASYLAPNSYAVNLLFPYYYGSQINPPPLSMIVLVGLSLVMLLVVTILYTQRVSKPE